MATEPLALAIEPPDALNDGEYQALREALSESVRGRAFLAEYARRNRNADTQAVLAAIDRIGTRLGSEASAVQRLRDDLRMLLIAIRLARPGIETAGLAAKAVRLATLLDLLERRIDAMSEGKPAVLAPPGEQVPGTRLAAVPPLDEPELPIPAATNLELRPIALVDGELQAAAAVTAVATRPASAADPLAALMALSEEERIALFT